MPRPPDPRPPFKREDKVAHKSTGLVMRVLACWHVGGGYDRSYYGTRATFLAQCKWGTRTHWFSECIDASELRAA